VILDTKGNIFGGFTPLEWNSEGDWKADDSQRILVFALKNPPNIPARRFALKAEKRQQAISCSFIGWMCFGYSPPDIIVTDDWNANTGSFTCLGTTYINDTGLADKIVFTGWLNFQVKEIEVFEMRA
jgi:hypothetical protein